MPTQEIAMPDRKAALQQRQQLKMAASAHAYVRGNTLRFYQWLRSDAVKGSVPVGPEVWICGDCHIGNLGPVADLDGQIDIQIRDLDQTVIGNPSHDLLRLGLSLAMAARGSDLPGVTTALMLEEMIAGYSNGLRGHSTSLSAQTGPIRQVMRQAVRRTWTHLAKERIDDVTPKIPRNKRFWPLTESEREEMNALFQGEQRKQIADCVNGDKVTLLDAAYWVKGCSSLGRLRYAVLVGVGKKKNRRFRLLDVKEATHADAPCGDDQLSHKMPSDDAERVVAGARQMSPFLGKRMMAATFSGRKVVIRELRPQDLKFELTGLTQGEAITTAKMMAGVVGKAHGRQMTLKQRTAWIKELKAKNAPTLQAPRWLWSGVVDLVALHEAAYLEHCRKYALGSKS